MKKLVSLLVGMAVIGSLSVTVLPLDPAGAAGPTLNVTPTVNVTRAGNTFLVKGVGFSTTVNSGFGVYVTFGPKPSLHPTNWFSNIALYQASVWVHPTGATGSATNKAMNPDGSFSFTLTNADGSSIKPVYGATDCTKIQCGILTMAAHGSTNRTQDTFRPIIFNTPDPTKAKVGVAYSTRVAPPAGVKPFTWTLKSGAIPPGLRLNRASGIISGTPTAEGVFRPTVEVVDASTPTATKVTRVLSIRVAPRPIVIAPATLPSRPRSVAFSRQLSATGGIAPYAFKVHSGSLPPGVTLSSTGRLSGTPTARGTFSFMVRATDEFAFAGTRTYSLTIT